MTTPPLVFLTGRPGVGKTTVVQNFTKRTSLRINGFITEELREHGRRIGFRIITTKGSTGILAKRAERTGKGPRVGSYEVLLDDLETIALPLLREAADVWVVDEIGKMELFSSSFRKTIQEAVQRRSLLATITMAPLSFTRELLGHSDALIIEVTPQNRDSLPDRLIEIFECEGMH